MNKKLDSLLQEYLVHDAQSMREYKALSEQLKDNLSRKMVDSAFNICIKKAEGLDYRVFDTSRGNIDKVDGISDLIESIAVIKNMQVSTHTPVEGLNTVEMALKNLRSLRRDFEEGYKREDNIVKFTYVNACVALFASVSYLIACNVEYVKSGPVATEMNLRNINKRKGLDSCMLKGLEQFNKMCLNGELQRIFASSMRTPALVNEAFPVAALGMAIIPALFTLVAFLRLVVYQYFSMRVSITEYCRLQAQFLEMNSTKIGMVKNMKKAAAKQAAVSSTLNKLADKIEVDQKTSSHKAQSDMHMEENNFNMTKTAYDDNIF